MPLLILAATYTMMLGGWWLWTVFIGLLVAFIVVDAALPEDLTEPYFGMTFLLNLSLYSVLPLLFLLNGTLLWLTVQDGTPLGLGVLLNSQFGIDIPWLSGVSNDPLGYGAFVQQWLGVDMFAARAATDHWAMWLGGILTSGLLTAAAGTVVGHELTHRLRKPFDVFMGRWMLAFTCDVAFATEHVYGHHVTVGTDEDPVTAKRGESIYSFVPRALFGAYAHAWRLERGRLASLGHSVLNPFVSPMMRGNLMSLSLFLAAYLIGGWFAVGIFAGVSLWGKVLLEITNFFEHYGLVRDPSKRVEIRHSWNSNKMLSSAVLFSLTRHSHHHAEPEAEFWTLEAYPEAPTLPYGYLTMILVALVPPLFERMMVPLLNDWDERFATPEERRIANEHNRKSGIPALVALAS
jgi:alkane 1-monooxygenase